ncbi:hypothetical protein GCM10020254_20730 [Streptomyces goshikiensis]
MDAIRASVDIARSPAEVYGYLTDPAHLPEWQHSAVRARPLDGAPSTSARSWPSPAGSVGAGSR